MAYGFLGWKPWEFAQIESVQEFDDVIRGAWLRHQLFEDVIGHLRVDVLRAGGVTFSDAPRPAKLKPGEKVPTFELLMGRKPVDPFGRTDQTDAQPMSDKTRRGKAMIEASHARKALREAARTGQMARPDGNQTTE